MLNESLLMDYQKKNPKKYYAKYGGRTPQEVMAALEGGPAPVVEVPKIENTELKTTIETKENVEMGFSDGFTPEVNPESPPKGESPLKVDPPKAKRKYTRKVKI